MTVKELVSELLKLDHDKEIRIDVGDSYGPEDDPGYSPDRISEWRGIVYLEAR